MKAGSRLPCWLIIAASFVFEVVVLSAEFPLSLRPTGMWVELSWPTAVIDATQGTVYPEYAVEYSSDLVHWISVGVKLRGVAGRSGSSFKLTFGKESEPLFYRVRADL